MYLGGSRIHEDLREVGRKINALEQRMHAHESRKDTSRELSVAPKPSAKASNVANAVVPPIVTAESTLGAEVAMVRKLLADETMSESEAEDPLWLWEKGIEPKKKKRKGSSSLREQPGTATTAQTAQQQDQGGATANIQRGGGVVAQSSQTARAFLRCSLSGSLYSFPGVCTKKNQWTMPAHLFQLQEIVGRYLIKLMLASDGSHFIEERHGGKLVLSKAPVSGFVSPKQEIRTYGPMFGALHPDGALAVCFGREKLREACEYKPCADLDDVSTPRSDSDTDTRFRE